MGSISLTIPLDATLCESCKEEIWVGWERCPHRDAAREPGTVHAAHLYRARVDIFEPLVQAAQVVNPTGLVPVTDTQYVRYINGSRVFHAEQIEDVVEAANALTLEDVESTRSIETRQAVQRLVRSADWCRRMLTDLKVITEWAMLGSNQRPLPCEGSVIVCWRFLECTKRLQIAGFDL